VKLGPQANFDKNPQPVGSELQEHDPEVFLNLIEDHMLAFLIQPESWK
jgi:hypothetical protein